MARERIYLDTNIFIRAFEGTGPETDMLRDLLNTPRAGGPSFVTSGLTFAEAVQAPYAADDRPLIAIYSDWLRASTPLLEVVPVSAGILYRAAALRSDYRSLRLPDAVHVATALDSGSSRFLSDDRRIPDRIVSVLRNVAPPTPPAEIAVVRPTTAFVATLTEHPSP